MLIHSFTLYYPDYTLPTVVRTDASTTAWAGVVFMVLQPQDDVPAIYLSLFCVSGKFSPIATRWKTLEQEGYAMVATVEAASYFLRGKHSVIETDHANLTFL